jgi:hypothetical protein
LIRPLNGKLNHQQLSNWNRHLAKFEKSHQEE